MATQGNYIIVASVSVDMIPIIETITVLVPRQGRLKLQLNQVQMNQVQLMLMNLCAAVEL